MRGRAISSKVSPSVSQAADSAAVSTPAPPPHPFFARPVARKSAGNGVTPLGLSNFPGTCKKVGDPKNEKPEKISNQNFSERDRAYYEFRQAEREAEDKLVEEFQGDWRNLLVVAGLEQDFKNFRRKLGPRWGLGRVNHGREARDLYVLNVRLWALVELPNWWMYGRFKDDTRLRREMEEMIARFRSWERELAEKPSTKKIR